jgi:hypothetical protein
MRKVLMTADTIGGVWTYTMELARGLAAHGVGIALATMGTPISALQRGEAEAIGNVELFESSFQLEWMPGAWKDSLLRRTRSTGAYRRWCSRSVASVMNRETKG